MADNPVTPIRKAAISDSSVGFKARELPYGLRFRDYGSYGLRQFSGWIREEFLPELTGLQAARTFREMMDNSSTIGSMLFAINAQAASCSHCSSRSYRPPMPERRHAEKINKPFVPSEGRQQLEKRTQPIGHKRLHLAPVGRKAA